VGNLVLNETIYQDIYMKTDIVDIEIRHRINKEGLVWKSQIKRIKLQLRAAGIPD